MFLRQTIRSVRNKKGLEWYVVHILLHRKTFMGVAVKVKLVQHSKPGRHLRLRLSTEDKLVVRFHIRSDTFPGGKRPNAALEK